MSKALVIMLELYVQRTAAEDVMPSAEAVGIDADGAKRSGRLTGHAA